MAWPRWGDLQKEWEPDGWLRHVYIHGTSERDWQAVVDAVRSQEWRLGYSEGGEPSAMPGSVGEIFAKQAAVYWVIWPGSGITIDCYFFAADEIEFSLTPSEIVSPTELAVVVGFMRLIGRASGKPVGVSNEGEPGASFMVYDPATDLVTTQ
jgi:hypothetical protein